MFDQHTQLGSVLINFTLLNVIENPAGMGGS